MLRRRTSLLWLIGLVTLAACLTAWRNWWRDRTVGVPPADLVRAAGAATLSAKGYRFTVHLATGVGGEAQQAANMHGGFQRSPQRLHLVGTVKIGARALDLEYYISGEGAMMRMGEHGAWRALYGPDVAQVRSFQPDELARVLRDQVTQASVVGRELFVSEPAVLLRPRIGGTVPWARPEAGTDPDGLEYRLWISTRTLLPLRLEITSRGKAGFQYRIDWDFSNSSAVQPPAGAAALLSRDQ